jgi:acetylornithine/succinyldiaminopimelate/putrescine aminotransferase
VFFSNSGAEANEGAVKLARKYGKLNRNGAYEVITALNSFHGRTLTMAAATGQPHYQEQWQPLAPGFVNVPYDAIDAIREATTDETCAVMVEPIQGEGGVIVPAPDYLAQVRDWCDRHNLVMILDEVQTGIGRLGTLFGYEQFGVEPDAITLAKGLGGGVPIGAFLAKEKFCVLAPGDHGSTYGGNALTTAAAYASTQFIIDNDISGNARTMGAHLTAALEDLKSRFGSISEVRGRGLLIALEFHDDVAADVLSNANASGVLLNMVKPNTLRFMPPLNITADEIDEGVARLEKAIASA